MINDEKPLGDWFIWRSVTLKIEEQFLYPSLLQFKIRR